MHIAASKDLYFLLHFQASRKNGSILLPIDYNQNRISLSVYIKRAVCLCLVDKPATDYIFSFHFFLHFFHIQENYVYFMITQNDLYIKNTDFKDKKD